MPSPSYSPREPGETRELESLILHDLGITVDDPKTGSAVVDAIGAALRSTPGTFSHRMAELEAWETAWGGADYEEE